MRQLGLDESHRVVAEVASQAAAKARQARLQRHLEALLIGRDEIQRVAFVAFDHDAICDHLGHKASGSQHRARGQPDEGIAPEALTADDGFEEKTVGAADAQVSGLGCCQLQVQRERGLKVRKSLGDQRDAVVSLGCEAIEFSVCHHVAGPSTASGKWH